MRGIRYIKEFIINITDLYKSEHSIYGFTEGVSDMMFYIIKIDISRSSYLKILLFLKSVELKFTENYILHF